MKWLNLGMVIVLAATVGCLKVDQTMTINKDGSGTLAMNYGMSEQTVKQMEAMQAMSDNMKEQGMEVEQENDNPFDFDEAKVREEFEQDKPDGIELVDVKSETKDGWRYMKILLKFDSLEALSKTEFFENNEFSLTKNADGNYVMVQESGDMGMDQGNNEMDSAMQEQMMEQMAPMMAGMRIAMTIKTPGKILETNATQSEGDQASWIFDIDKDPRVLSKMKDMNLRLVFDGKGVDIPEMKSAGKQKPADVEVEEVEVEQVEE